MYRCAGEIKLFKPLLTRRIWGSWTRAPWPKARNNHKFLKAQLACSFQRGDVQLSAYALDFALACLVLSQFAIKVIRCYAVISQIKSFLSLVTCRGHTMGLELFQAHFPIDLFKIYQFLSGFRLISTTASEVQAPKRWCAARLAPH